LPASIVGIAGGTASGKTTLARTLAARLGDGCVLVSHDRYYLPRGEGDPGSRNYDHPDALDNHRLASDLLALRNGRSAELPIYDFARHDRAADTDRIEPRPVVILEGILILAVEVLRRSLDLRVFVDVPDDLRLVRRIRRDMAERGRAAQDVLDQYERTVRPMHQAFVASSRTHADLVVDGTIPVELSVELLVRHLPR